MMIQRIQSVYFLLMALVSALMFLLPVAHFETAEGVVLWNVGGYDHPVLLGDMSISYSMMPGILVVVSGVVALLTLLMYGQRPMQIRICRINMIVIILFIASLFYVSHATGESIAVVRYAYLPGAYLSLLLPILNYLALGAIRGDERKVRAADRLR